MACRRTADGWREPSHSKPCLGPPGAHPARLRAPLAWYFHVRARFGAKKPEFRPPSPAGRAGVARTPSFRQVYYLWNLLKRLESVAGSMLSQLSGFAVALSIT